MPEVVLARFERLDLGRIDIKAQDGEARTMERMEQGKTYISQTDDPDFGGSIRDFLCEALPITDRPPRSASRIPLFRWLDTPPVTIIIAALWSIVIHNPNSKERTPMKRIAAAFLLLLAPLALAQTTTSQPAKVYTSITAMLADVPKDLLPVKDAPAPVNAPRVDPQTPGLQKWIDSNRATVNVSLEMPITVIDKQHIDAQGNLPVHFQLPPSDILNRQRRVDLTAYFPKDAAAKFATLKVGDKVTVEGEANMIKINEYYVQLTIFHPHLK